MNKKRLFRVMITVIIGFGVGCSPCFSNTIIETENNEVIVTKSVGEYVLGTSESPVLAKKTIIELTKSESANYIGSYIYKEVSLSDGKLRKDETVFYTLSNSALVSYNDSKSIKTNTIIINYVVKHQYKKSDIKKGIEQVQSNIALKNQFIKLKSEYESLIKKISGENNDDSEDMDRNFLLDSFAINAKKSSNLFSSKSVDDVIKISRFNFDIDKKKIDDAFRMLERNSVFHIKSYEIKPYQDRAVAVIKYSFESPSDLFWKMISPLFVNLKDDNGRISKEAASKCKFVPFSIDNSYECKLLEYFDSQVLRVSFKDKAIDEYYYVRRPVKYEFNVEDTIRIYLDSYHTPSLEYDVGVFLRDREPEQLENEEARKKEVIKKEAKMYECFSDARQCRK